MAIFLAEYVFVFRQSDPYTFFKYILSNFRSWDGKKYKEFNHNGTTYSFDGKTFIVNARGDRVFLKIKKTTSFSRNKKQSINFQTKLKASCSFFILEKGVLKTRFNVMKNVRV